jgi:hypothetical protein
VLEGDCPARDDVVVLDGARLPAVVPLVFPVALVMLLVLVPPSGASEVVDDPAPTGGVLTPVVLARGWPDAHAAIIVDPVRTAAPRRITHAPDIGWTVRPRIADWTSPRSLPSADRGAERPRMDGLGQ